MTPVTATTAYYAYISSAWVLLEDVAPIHAFWGMADNNPTSRVAEVGELTLALNNSTGQYSPNGPSALAGWKKGIPFKMVVTFEGEDYIRFRGTISDIQISPNNKDKKAYVTVLDWMDYASRHPIVNPGIQTNKTGDQVLTTILSELSVQPQVTSFDTGIETFATVFDTVTSKTKAYNEFSKVALSELGYVYLKKDKTNGETLVFESGNYRPGYRDAEPTRKANADTGYLLKEGGGYLLKEDGGKIIIEASETVTFDSFINTDFDARYGENVINRMTVFAYPRRLDASPQILFQLDEPILVESGESKVVKGYYSDPNGGLPINAQDMISPVGTTDFLMNTSAAGTGTNLTATGTIIVDYGTEGFSHTISNSAGKGYITKLNCRGTGIYVYNPIEHAATNSASVTEFEISTETFYQKYKNTLDNGAHFVDSVVDEFKQPLTVLNSITFCANRSSSCMMNFLETDIGNIRYISIAEAGIAGNYYIQGVEVTIKGNIIMCKWIVKLALSLLVGLSPIAVEFEPTTNDAIDFGAISRVNNLSTKSISIWIYVFSGGGLVSEIMSNNDVSDDNSGWRIRILDVVSGSTSQFYYWRGHTTTAVQSGQWYSNNNPGFSINAWHHIVIVDDVQSLTADAHLYVDSVLQPISKFAPESLVLTDETGNHLVIGNANTVGVYDEGFDGKISDARIYNRVLTQADVTTLYNGGTPDANLVTDGLVFQAFAVRTGDLASCVNQTLTSATLLRDNIFGELGYPKGTPIGRTAP